MALIEELKTYGVNVEEALDRMMGNTALYEKMLGRFVDMAETSAVTPDFDNNDYQEIIEKAHALKGATGNLSLTPLYEAYTEIVSLLRKDDPEQAKKILTDILPVQKDILDCIQKNKS